MAKVASSGRLHHRYSAMLVSERTDPLIFFLIMPASKLPLVWLVGTRWVKNNWGGWYTTIPHCTHCMFVLCFHRTRNDTSTTKQSFLERSVFWLLLQMCCVWSVCTWLHSAACRRTGRVVGCKRTWLSWLRLIKCLFLPANYEQDKFKTLSVACEEACNEFYLCMQMMIFFDRQLIEEKRMTHRGLLAGTLYMIEMKNFFFRERCIKSLHRFPICS